MYNRFRVHIRRTDKLQGEAKFHALENYMVHVEDWFQQYERHTPGVTRRVFLATDDPLVADEAKSK